jgi:hypothetical protein
MTAMLRVPRSRGAISGLLLVLLGLWGALIPLIGPYFSYAYTPDSAWKLTSGRIWLEIAPGAVTVLGGIILLVTAMRPMAMTGAALAAVSGAWFAVGAVMSPLWANALTLSPGSPVGGPIHRSLEQLGFYTGLGVVIVFIAAVAAGRLSVVAVRDTRLDGNGAVTARRERAAAAENSDDEAVTAPASRVHSFGRWLVARN